MQSYESKLLWQGSGLLDHCLAINILSIKLVKLLLLVPDCLLLFCCSYRVAALLRNFADSIDTSTSSSHSLLTSNILCQLILKSENHSIVDFTKEKWILTQDKIFMLPFWTRQPHPASLPCWVKVNTSQPRASEHSSKLKTRAHCNGISSPKCCSWGWFSKHEVVAC